ncbi:sulfatase-like hydrolase/transferase [Deltaproteobacteria bacterium IMCC39524]|nr:sulfatase-like hydrolase/transferase [Deltaproteobacteria bacterium IMCC39524]
MRHEFARITLLTILASYIYLFMEWLFFITKPSFLTRFSILQSIEVLATAPLFLVLVTVPSLLFIGLLTTTTRKSWRAKLFRHTALLLPALIIAATAFLLFENFTYTLFGFNVGLSGGIIRFIYALLIILLFVCSNQTLHRWLNSNLWNTKGRIAFFFVGTLVTLSTVITVTNYLLAKVPDNTEVETHSTLKEGLDQFPNILILSADGLNATHMSAYGYHRNTTPFIKKILPESLLFENNFTNNSNSPGSIGSLLSGKLPTNTKVIYNPDIFTSIHIYQHLPGVLRKKGYRSADISIRHYGDAYDLNMREAFHMVNGRTINEETTIPILEKINKIFEAEVYFLEQTLERIKGRLFHTFRIKNMVNAFSMVTQKKKSIPDSERIKQFFDFIEDSPEPFFVHMHLMGTHGPKFFPRHSTFSAGKEQDNKWMDDFYDDAILDFDDNVREVVQHLKKIGQYENTLIILTSDHGKKWEANQRLPLIIRFPNQQHRGLVTKNVQIIDIAPAILDYLGLEVPGWLDGEPLLLSDAGIKKPIISTIVKQRDWINGLSMASNYNAPFYSLHAVSVIIRDRFYCLSLKDGQIVSSEIEGHTNPLDENEVPSATKIKNFIFKHLKENKYDISSLQ